MDDDEKKKGDGGGGEEQQQQQWSENCHLEIDCAPGSARPDAILAIVLSSINTTLTSDDFKVVGTFFGEWTFALKKEKEAAYKAAKKEIGDQLKTLNAQGAIRYASW